ncbi:facilitated trehalose transporter Tret1-like [Aethina tumida]|uniref:facilitated trehalose transporter Tret1-like n=1 Tax=Aethina tumida TaxID=116153 RepID=UPI00214909EB|nr:facilitated trehalose transporter Tret1-like [Aethina tumida]
MKIAINNYLYQYLAAFTGCLSMMSTGMHYGWPSPSLPVLQSPDSPMPITSEQGSIIITILEYGNIVGCIVGAFIVDRIGRKNTILLTSPLFFVCWIMLAQFISIYFMMSARFLAGLSGGIICTVAPMYLGEISQPEIRGLLSSLIQVLHILGQLVFNIFGNLLGIDVAAYICAVVPVLQFVTFVCMPESPYYLIMKNRHSDAEKSLHKFNNGVEVENTLKEIVNSFKEEKASKISVFEIITDPANRKAVYITFGLRFFQQATGITAISFYVKTILIDVNTGLSPSTISIIYFMLQLMVCSLNSTLIDKTGRKPLLIFSFIGTGIANAVLSIYFYFSATVDFSETYYKFIPVIGILIYVLIFNIGLASTPVVLLGEFFNTRVKAIAMASADIFFSILIIIVSFFFQFTKDYVGLYIPFAVFSILAIFGFLFVYYCIPETKGMSLEKIQLYLRGITNDEDN